MCGMAITPKLSRSADQLLECEAKTEMRRSGEEERAVAVLQRRHHWEELQATLSAGSTALRRDYSSLPDGEIAAATIFHQDGRRPYQSRCPGSLPHDRLRRLPHGDLHDHDGRRLSGRYRRRRRSPNATALPVLSGVLFEPPMEFWDIAETSSRRSK